MPNRIYLDHASTTPVLPEAAAAIAAGLAAWANPSSAHADGRASRAALEDARTRMAAALGWEGRVIFTSGATEAISIAICQSAHDDLFVSAVEHPAVLRCAAGRRRLKVDANGRVDLADLQDALAGAVRPLVAVQQVNNEIGVIQPLEGIAERVAAAGGLLLADCAQAAGKLPLPEADFITLAAHKLGGPPGIGALLVRDPAHLRAVGGQEGGYRPGTTPVPLVLGFAAAVEAGDEWLKGAAELRAHLEEGVLAAGGEVLGRGAPRVPTIGAYRLPGTPAAAQLMQLDLAGISVSAGSACTSGSVKPSHVLAAMGLEEGAAREVIRVSFGRSTSAADVDAFLAQYRLLAERRRAA